VNAQEVFNTACGEVQASAIRVQGKVVIKAQKIHNAKKSQILGQHVDLNAETLFSNSDSTLSVSSRLPTNVSEESLEKL
jgi:hypothetical protein